MRFDEFMRLALYHPHYGYYSRGDRIFGKEGDFVTAPSLSPLFGHTLGKAMGEALTVCTPVIYEFGAGDGRLACDILSAIGNQVEKYNIIDLSGGLKEKQASRIERELSPELAQKVNWLFELPEHFEGIVIGNELLDAMPVRRFVWTTGGTFETFVTLEDMKTSNGIPNKEVTQEAPFPVLNYVDLPAGTDLTQVTEQLREKHGPWPSPFRSELGIEARAWVETITQKLCGFAIMIDYGRDAEQYYNHTQSEGFLRAHSQHIAHDGFLEGIGLQDLTCHVDFSGIYESIVHAGGELEGYCTQSAFLRHHGILDFAANDAKFLDPLEGGAHRQAVNMLLSEAEMGETFKVMCWSKGLELPEGSLRSSFIQHDLSHLL